MRLMLIAVLVVCALAGCGSGVPRRPAGLSKAETRLAAKIGFDKSVMTTVTRFTGGRIVRLKGLDQAGDETVLDGISFGVPENKVSSTLEKLGPELASKGYYAFVAEMNFGEEPDRIGVLRTRDQFEVVRARQTNGINYDIDNEAVVTRLRKWHKLYGIEVTGAGMDWVQFDLKRLPGDVGILAKEVYRFCPDSVDQGPGDVSTLADDIRESKQVYLWWD